MIKRPIVRTLFVLALVFPTGRAAATNSLLQPSHFSNEIAACSGGGTHGLACLFTGVFILD